MSELRKMTKLGGDVRRLAALLQARAPKGEMLAYINPREAAILKAHGGSGEVDPETGIPSFDDGFDTGGFEGLDQGQVDTAAAQQQAAPQISAAPEPSGGGLSYKSPSSGFSLGGDTGGGQGLQLGSTQGLQAAPSAIQTPSLPPAPGYDITTSMGAAPEAPAPEKSLLGGMSKDTLSRLGLAGGLGLLGASAARRAQQQGQAGTAEMQALATPYQKAGQAAQSAAQRGELLPVGQQSLQAAQAQINQDITRRGGVGVQQAATQIENLRQQLLQQQYDYGLKLSGIGDNIALGAIKTGLQTDQYVNQLTNSFYTNMAYIASGMSPGVRTTTPTQGASA